jgi:hypothetical protein
MEQAQQAVQPELNAFFFATFFFFDFFYDTFYDYDMEMESWS